MVVGVFDMHYHLWETIRIMISRYFKHVCRGNFYIILKGQRGHKGDILRISH